MAINPSCCCSFSVLLDAQEIVVVARLDESS
jgi:hypothetical protein